MSLISISYVKNKSGHEYTIWGCKNIVLHFASAYQLPDRICFISSTIQQPLLNTMKIYNRRSIHLTWLWVKKNLVSHHHNPQRDFKNLRQIIISNLCTTLETWSASKEYSTCALICNVLEKLDYLFFKRYSSIINS